MIGFFIGGGVILFSGLLGMYLDRDDTLHAANAWMLGAFAGIIGMALVLVI